MKINLYLIREFIQNIQLNEKVSSNYSECNILRPSIYTKSIKLNPELVYIISPEALAFLDPIPDDVCFILTAPPDVKLINRKVDFLYPDSDIILEELLDRLLEVFQLFAQWESEMYRCMSEPDPLQTLGDCSVRFLRNPTFLADSAFRILYYYEKEKPRQFRYFTEKDKGSYIEEDSIQELIARNDFIQSWDTEEPSLFGSEFEGGLCLYQNLTVEGKKAARIVISQIDEPIHKADYAVLKVFSEFILRALERQNVICLSIHSPYLDQAILELAHGHSNDFDQIMSHVAILNWKRYDTYFCCLLQAPRDSRIGSISNACQRLEDCLNGSCAVQDGNYIFYIVNLRIAGKNRNSATITVAEQLREFMLRAGISIEFQDLARLPYYFNQASIALDLGSRYDSTLWSYRFEHYMLSYVAEQCMQELDAEALCPIGLLKLREYCREKGRDYDVTLRIFLENNMSIANTIRKIHMQRATFLYQLNKIQKIMGVDLQNYETRLQLMIAYQLLDKESKENEVSEREYAEL